MGDFYAPRHQAIFQCMVTLFEAGKPVDLNTVAQCARDLGLLKVCGEERYIGSIVDTMALHASVGEYLSIIRDCSMRRKILDIGQRATEAALGTDVPTRDLVHAVSQGVLDISRDTFDDKTKGTAEAIDEEILSLFSYADRVGDGSMDKGVVATGFTDLDNLLCGLHPGCMYIVAARPGIGKTSFAIDCGLYAAERYDATVCMFSMEMSSSEIMRRMLSSISGVDSYLIRSGRLYTEERAKLEEASVVLRSKKFIIDESSRLSPVEVRARSRNALIRHKSERNLIIVDYLQLMEASLAGRGGDGNRQQEITTISRQLKGLAREMDAPIIVLSQLNRAVESREDPCPRLSDLRESGAIEQDADGVLFLYKAKDEPETDERVCIMASLAKHRAGPVGQFCLNFEKKTTSFKNIEKSE